MNDQKLNESINQLNEAINQLTTVKSELELQLNPRNILDVEYSEVLKYYEDMAKEGFNESWKENN